MSRLNKSSSGQLWWVILLLAVAVILPTVCLLWFMTQAIKNERLAVKEKLLSVYNNRIKTSVEENLGSDWIRLNLSLAGADGFLVFDSNDNLIFPVADFNEDIASDEDFGVAYKLEYTEGNPADAMAEYNRIADNAKNDAQRIKAEIAGVRCLTKLNQIAQAIEKLQAALSKYGDNSLSLRAQKCRAMVLLVELCRQKNSEEFKRELSSLFDYTTGGIEPDNIVLLGTKVYADKSIPTSLQLFVLERFLKYAEDMKDNPFISEKYKEANRLVSIFKMSLRIPQIFNGTSFISEPGIVYDHVFRLDTEEQLYGHYDRAGPRKYFKIYHRQTVEYWFYPYIEDMEQLPSQCSIYDEKGNFLAGTKAAGRKPFIKADLNVAPFPGWTTELYIDDSAFEDAADKQAAVYIWTGALVIVLILSAGGFAGQALSRQIKLNRLKNDFIATVSHELKTPLASMRVLADTLLEGSYKDQEQATEYLQLICKENKRLSGLIDNFLTFSRMERNKQVFDFAPAEPAGIANAAVEAVQTKLDKKNCKFSVIIDNNLPSIVVDKDAIVTVLINLLDNACKYSYDDKQIELKVFACDDSVCFSVSDNGIGMTRRQIRRIFERFYQADTSLTRRATGCGLGLAITKFIVDAHKGKIAVESRSGRGSKFTVKIPAA